eukprot:3935460-Rhodomonas_salina.1
MRVPWLCQLGSNHRGDLAPGMQQRELPPTALHDCGFSCTDAASHTAEEELQEREQELGVCVCGHGGIAPVFVLGPKYSKAVCRPLHDRLPTPLRTHHRTEHLELLLARFVW